MSEEITPETREGFKIYAITLETGEELKYPAMNHDDFENLTAGFLEDFRALAKEYQAADTNQEKANVATSLHWLVAKESLTVSEVKQWRALKQKAFYTAMALGAEVSGATAKK